MQASDTDIQDVLKKKAKRKENLNTVLPLMGLIFITLLLIIITKGALIRGSNLVNLLNQCFAITIASVGAAFVFAHGGIDFSIGSSCGLAQLVMITLLTRYGVPVYIAILVSIITCVTASTIVGSVAILLRVPPFITSLCVRSICAGILAIGANAAGGQMSIDYAKYIKYNNVFLKLGVLIVIIALGYFFFEKAIFGRDLKAIGGNEVVAFQAGRNVNKSKILAYSFLGLCVGIVAFFQLTRMGVVTANSGSGLEFDVMIAIALGGFPMAGGSSAKLRAVIIGAITSTVLSNGLIIWGLDVIIVNLVRGLLFIIIIAITYDRSTMKQVGLLP